MENLTLYGKSPVHLGTGKFIRLHRKRQGFTIEELAAQSSVSVNSIGQIERGKRNPSVETFVKLAIGLGVCPTLIFSEVCEEISPYITEVIKKNILED